MDAKELLEVRFKPTKETALVVYVSDSTRPGSDINLDNVDVEQLLEEGADSNAAREGSGKTVMHILAATRRHWNKEIAEKLIERDADVNKPDQYGRTPLHFAAASNNMEALEWLLGHGAELELKTLEECQTPLHYAARHDSIKAMKALLKKGSELEARDYAGRTPLHLAIQMDRALAADFLVSLPKPADIQTQDNSGNSVMACMISAIPRVAYVALNQLHQVDVAKRIEKFELYHLEPDKSKEIAHIKTPFEVAVDEKKKHVVAHPVMQALLEIKWKFIRPFFFGHLAIFILFTVLWSIDFAYPSVQEKHVYNFPRDSWRVIMEVAIVIIYLMGVTNEVISLTQTIQSFKWNRKCSKRAMQTDLDRLILDSDERELLESKIDQQKIIPEFIKDLWVVLSWFTNFLILVVILLHIVNIVNHTTAIALWEGRMGCFTTILVWFQLMKFLRVSLKLGPIVAIIVASFEYIVYFLFIAAMFYAPFVLSFWVMFGGSQAANVTSSDVQALEGFHDVAMMVFRLMLIDDYPFNAMREIDAGMTFVLVGAFLLIMGLVGVNLFIALLSKVVEEVDEASQANAALQRAFLIRSYHKRIWLYNLYKRYYDYILRCGNPYIKSYDDRQVVLDRKIKRPWVKVLDRLEGINNHLEKMDREVEDLKRRVIQSDDVGIRSSGGAQL